MATINTTYVMKAEIHFSLDEEEAMALDALAGYGDEAFLEVFYRHLGKAYLQPHEKGLRSLFKAVRGPMAAFYEKTNKARAALNGYVKDPLVQPVHPDSEEAQQ